jgi:hypothetical protein
MTMRRRRAAVIAVLGCLAVAAGTAALRVALPRTVTYKAWAFERFRRRSVETFKREREAHPGRPGNMSGYHRLLESLGPRQVRLMASGRRIAYADLRPDQRRVFAEFEQNLRRRFHVVNALGLSSYEGGLVFWWVVDGRQFSLVVGERPRGRS